METLPSLCQGRYILRKLLGEGGMGTVYVAYDKLLDVHRAIKLLAPRLCLKEKIRQRFLDEARAMARLQHPNIVTVHDVGLEGENQPYIIMQLIGGGSAGDVFEPCGPQRRPTAVRPSGDAASWSAAPLSVSSGHVMGILPSRR